MGERGDDLRLVRILQGRGCGVKKRRLETYADVVQKQKETPPPEPSQDKPRVLTTLMKVGTLLYYLLLIYILKNIHIH